VVDCASEDPEATFEFTLGLLVALFAAQGLANSGYLEHHGPCDSPIELRVILADKGVRLVAFKARCVKREILHPNFSFELLLFRSCSARWEDGWYSLCTPIRLTRRDLSFFCFRIDQQIANILVLYFMLQK